MRVAAAVRRVLSALCWTLAVVAGALTAAAFAGSGFACQAGRRTSCSPPTWILVVGIVATIGFGVAGALLWKPRTGPPEPRFPWEYRNR